MKEVHIIQFCIGLVKLVFFKVKIAKINFSHLILIID